MSANKGIGREWKLATTSGTPTNSLDCRGEPSAGHQAGPSEGLGNVWENSFAAMCFRRSGLIKRLTNAPGLQRGMLLRSAAARERVPSRSAYHPTPDGFCGVR